jgi:hypothetical protein
MMIHTISHPDLAALYRRKFAESDEYSCTRALQDCHETLRLHEHCPASAEYVRKLWCEIDAIRDRQMEIRRNVRELRAMGDRP